MDLVWLPEARDERRSQLAYIASQNPMAALSVGLRLRNAVEMLVDFPLSGRLGRRADTRELIVPRTSLIVVYRLASQSDEIQILNVLHARQKYPPDPQPE